MLISDKYNFAFIHNTKCAGTTTTNFLILIDKDIKRVGVHNFPEIIDRDILCGIRNPIDHCISYYLEKNFGEKTFNYIENNKECINSNERFGLLNDKKEFKEWIYETDLLSSFYNENDTNNIVDLQRDCNKLGYNFYLVRVENIKNDIFKFLMSKEIEIKEEHIEFFYKNIYRKSDTKIRKEITKYIYNNKEIYEKIINSYLPHFSQFY
jgi:hypothetical protein